MFYFSVLFSLLWEGGVGWRAMKAMKKVRSVSDYNAVFLSANGNFDHLVKLKFKCVGQLTLWRVVLQRGSRRREG